MKNTISSRPAVAFLCFLFCAFAGCERDGTDAAKPLRVGFFPNITHAQAIIAQQMEVEGRSWYASRMPADTRIEWAVFNAGPTAMEQLLIGAIDLSYVGPNPALNAYANTAGRDVRQLAGAARGGSALVVQPELNATKPADFAGKKIGTPQFGNTQDVACRSWLVKGGLKIHTTGGDAQVIPTQNPELVQIFGQKNLDAVWTVEPWVTRLVRDYGGKIVLEQPRDITTLLVTGESALGTRAGAVAAFRQAHVELTAWINAHPDEAAVCLHRGLERITKTRIDPTLVATAFKRITFDATVDRAAMQTFVDDAFAIRMLKARPDLENFFRHADDTARHD
ncbi:MAG: ABC transporter substrate-binding protein [Puniceicoccales bacterium]|jgi:NitT/TauT family transport system substrate-binding protein|nr:ABC transporter substrate-binding protein [Puniceicoccales bacterium]